MMIPRAPTQQEYEALVAYLAHGLSRDGKHVEYWEKQTAMVIVDNAAIAVFDEYRLDSKRYPGYANKILVMTWFDDPHMTEVYVWSKEGIEWVFPSCGHKQSEP